MKNYNQKLKTILIFPIVFFGVLVFGKIAFATTLIDENFNNRSFNNGIINVYNDPGGYCTGLGCPWGAVSRGETGYSLQGSHDVSGYNIMLATAADPWDYMQTGFYYRYYLYFPTSYWFAPECAGYANYQNQKLFKFSGPDGKDVEGGLIYDAGVGAVTSVYMQFSKEDGGTDSGIWYAIPAGHYMFKNQWNKVEMYIQISPGGSHNSTIHLAINGVDTIWRTNETVSKGSYASAKQVQSIRVTGGPPYAPMPPSGHGTWYLDDLKIVYGEGDLVGSDGVADTIAPTVPTNLTATAVSSTQINLSWTASTDNVGVTGYRIYRCSGSGCTPSTQISTSAVNSYSDTGLSPSTTYVYRVAAYDAAGNVSGQSSSATATTQAPPDTTPPASPTGLSVI